MRRLTDHTFFALREGSPQNKNDGLVAGAQNLNHAICEFFPTAVPVRSSMSFLHRKNGIEKQNALIGPGGEVARFRDGYSEIAMKFFINVF
jgi:hypothetical protein